VPAGANRLYSFPAISAYLTDAPAKATAVAMRSLLTAQGWQPYGTAGDSQFFKKNAVKLNARSAVSPGQGGKTMIQYSCVLLSADLPAPPDCLQVAYADNTKTLSLDVDMTPVALAAFYREALGKAGWESTTERPVTLDFKEMMFFRNVAKDFVILSMQEVDGKLRALLKHQTAAEYAEEERRARGSEEKTEPTQQPAARNMVTVEIALPASAKGVKRSGHRLEFSLTSGTARPAVQAIRDDLLGKRWKSSFASLEQRVGTLLLSKSASVAMTINYRDTGLDDATVTVSTIGATIEEPCAK
jgi:hypothetical protein